MGDEIEMKESEFKNIIENFAKESGTLYTRDLVDDIIHDMEINIFDVDDEYTFEPMRNQKKKWR